MEFSFSAEVERQDYNFKYHIVRVPAEVHAAYRDTGLHRIVGTINGLPYRLALISDGEGGSFIIFSMAKYLKKAGAKEGSKVQITLSPDPEPAEYPMPEELAEVLVQTEGAEELFFALTLGRQRGLAGFVADAKSVEVRLKRAFEMVRRLTSGTLYSQQNKTKE